MLMRYPTTALLWISILVLSVAADYRKSAAFLPCCRRGQPARTTTRTVRRRRQVPKRRQHQPSPLLLLQSSLRSSIDDGMMEESSSGWSDLNPESLVAAPCLIEQTLCQANEEEEQPQLAKDVAYARAVLDAWKEEDAAANVPWDAEWRPWRYQDDDAPLYGHLIRRRPNPNHNSPKKRGVIFFHTAAGPHDLFLLYKAAALVNGSDGQVTVLIADILSDPTGWAWDPDRTRYNEERNKLRQSPRVLQARCRAAVETLQRQIQRESENDTAISIAAMGWCLGGQAILQTSQLNEPSLRALVTFHGVFDTENIVVARDSDNENEDPTATQSSPPPPPPQILICHGTDDPFVSPDSLEQALEIFQTTSQHRASLLQLAGAKHGFTNPAQEFNDNAAFDYNPEAADKAWKQAMGLIQRAWK